MAIKLVSMKCPECGAVLDVEEGRKQIFCSYCGNKIIIDNENEFIYRTIDEAGVKQAETDREVQLKRMELIEKHRAAKEKQKKFKIGISVLLGAITLIAFAIGYGSGNSEGALMVGMMSALILMYMWIFSMGKNDDEDDLDFGDKVKIPSGISDYESKSYTAIEAMLRAAGFTNIQCIPLNDLTTGLLKKPGMVESVTINGQGISYGKKYSKEAAIMISYHSFAGR